MHIVLSVWWSFSTMAFNGAPYVIQPPMIVSLRKSAEKIVSRHVRTDTRQTSRTQNSELRILFNIIHEDCNKLVIVTIIKITVIKGKKYETKYIILFNKKKL